MTQAWNSFEPHNLDKNFVTLQGCLDEIIQLDGDNNYKIQSPHEQGERGHLCLPQNLHGGDVGIS